MTTPEERIARYTEGVCADGAAILCDGNPMSISEVLDVLNAPSIGDADKPTEPGLLDYPTDDSGGLQPYDAWGGPDSGDADKQAQQAADAVGVTPHSDMRPFVEQAVKYARYFESRPTGGEDRAHWANVYNAENARKVAAQLAAVERERDDVRNTLKDVIRLSEEAYQALRASQAEHNKDSEASFAAALAAVERERDEAIKTIADMAERFRAVNVSEAIKQTIGENVFALRERAEAAEAKVLALTAALKSLVDDDCMYDGEQIIIQCDSHSDAIARIRIARAALEQASKAAP